MATVDHEAELSKAGANVQGRLGSFLYWCRSYPLGAIGALIVVIFVLMAIFADFITGFDPTAEGTAGECFDIGKAEGAEGGDVYLYDGGIV